MQKILIISGDTIDATMGGMGVRYWEIAHALSDHCSVTLAIPNETKLVSDSFRIFPFDLEKGDLSEEASLCNVIIIQGFILHFHPYLKDLGKPLAVDLYDPHLLESLVWHDQSDWSKWIPTYEEYLRVQLELIRYGDFFFCASERQRDYWLGWLHAQKRINPHVYRDDPTLRRMIDLVPFGIPEEPPVHTRQVLRGIHPWIDENSKIILWSGGIWDWLDPLTVIESMPAVLEKCPHARLFFMGTKHPNQNVNGMEMPGRAIELSKTLGLFDKQVIFGDWVPYQERMNYLLEANVGVVAYQDHIETHFSFRTRLLDCIWAGLPVVTTGGDTFSEVIVKNQLGFCIAEGNTRELADALLQLLSDERSVDPQAFQVIQNQYTWPNTISPLLDFCLSPYPAVDKGQYLTETERIVKDKDAYWEHVVEERDIFYRDIIDTMEKSKQGLSWLVYRALKYVRRKIGK